MAGYLAQPTVASRALWPMLRAAEARGTRPAEVLEGLVSPEDFWRPDFRLPHALSGEIGLRIATLSASTDVLLHAYEHVEAGDFDVLAYASRSSATILDSLMVADQYIRLMHDAVVTEVSMAGDHGVWRFEFARAAEADVLAYNYLMSVLVRGGARIIGAPELFTEVRFAGPPPPEADEYGRAWGVPVRFAAGENAVLYPRAALSQSLRGADAGLHGILARHAQQLLESMPPLSDLSGRVRQLLAAELGSGDTSLSHVARRLAMAPSTLRRHLKKEGKTHREILDELRLQMALRHLKDPRLPVSEIAFLLGFGEVSAFDKAFKRWTGRRPSELRP